MYTKQLYSKQFPFFKEKTSSLATIKRVDGDEYLKINFCDKLHMSIYFIFSLKFQTYFHHRFLSNYYTYLQMLDIIEY